MQVAKLGVCLMRAHMKEEGLTGLKNWALVTRFNGSEVRPVFYMLQTIMN